MIERESINKKGISPFFYLLIRQLSILDPSDTYRFLSDGVYIVRRAPKRFLGQLSSLIHRSNALGSSHGGKSQNVVVLLLFAASTHSLLSPASSHTERKSPGPTCRSANVKRGVEPELANRSHFRNHTSYS